MKAKKKWLLFCHKATCILSGVIFLPMVIPEFCRPGETNLSLPANTSTHATISQALGSDYPAWWPREAWSDERASGTDSLGTARLVATGPHHACV